MTKTLCLSVVIIVLLSQVSCGQSRTHRENANLQHTTAPSAPSSQNKYPNLRTQAEEVGNAFVRKDFNTMADLTYPKLVEFMGGRARMIALIERDVKQMETEGFTFVSVSVDESKEIINVGKQLFATVPTTLTMKVAEGMLVGQSFMIGVSEDEGKHWTFVDGAGLDKAKLKTLFPTAANKLRLPEKKQPVLYPNNK